MVRAKPLDFGLKVRHGAQGSVPFLIRDEVFGVSVASSGVKRAETFLGYLRLPG